MAYHSVTCFFVHTVQSSKGERERERETDRQTDRQTDREKESDREREFNFVCVLNLIHS